MVIPQNYERTKKDSEKTIHETLLDSRSIFLTGSIDIESATNLIAQLLYLENKAPGKDITLYINSPGGCVHSTCAIIDTMRFISSDVSTTCIGMAMSGGALILSSGAKGKRHILKHGRVMIHQPLGGVSGQASDIRIQMDEMNKCKKEVTSILSENTGKSYDQVLSDCERDNYLNADEALAYGIIDTIVGK